MINLGVTGNYMSPDFKRYLRLLEIKKAQSKPISELSSKNLGSHLTEKSRLIYIIILDHKEQINFNIISLGQYNIIFGIPWLRNHNPDINWKTTWIYFINYICSNIIELEQESGIWHLTAACIGRRN